MAAKAIVVHTLADGTRILARPGAKPTSPHDFIVLFKRPEARSRARQPKHIHLIIDLYMKRMGNPWLTTRLLDHMINILINQAVPADGFPPGLTHYSQDIMRKFSPLDAFGEYSVEFVLVVGELLAKAEKTNYPNGHVNRDLWMKFKDGAEIFSVVSAATWRG